MVIYFERCPYIATQVWCARCNLQVSPPQKDESQQAASLAQMLGSRTGWQFDFWTVDLSDNSDRNLDFKPGIKSKVGEFSRKYVV